MLLRKKQRPSPHCQVSISQLVKQHIAEDYQTTVHKPSTLVFSVHKTHRNTARHSRDCYSGKNRCSQPINLCQTCFPHFVKQLIPVAYQTTVHNKSSAPVFKVHNTLRYTARHSKRCYSEKHRDPAHQSVSGLFFADRKTTRDTARHSRKCYSEPQKKLLRKQQ